MKEKNRASLEKTVDENERELSIVIPVCNEEKNLTLLHSQLKSILETLGRSYEVIFVDDGSYDNSFSILEKLHHQDSNVKVIQFRKNFGKAAALSAGFIDLLTVMFLTKYMKKPLHLFGGIGFLFFLAGFVINVYLAILWFQGQGIGGRPLLLLGVLLMLVGFQIVFTGLIGEMIVSVRHKGERGYIIKKILK